MATKEENNEKELLHRLYLGDAIAAKSLYSTYIRYLTAVCARYIVNDEDVRDVLQDAFVHIYSTIRRFEYRGEGSLKAWLTRVVINESLKFLRDKEDADWVCIDDVSVDLREEEMVDTESIPIEVIHRMIRELPDGYRTIFNLYAIEGRSHKEIAELLQIKESSSASQLHRAKAMLISKIRLYQRQINML